MLLTLGVGGPGATDAEPVEVESVSDHVLLGLEKDDVHLGCKQTAQHNKATETHRDAHGGGLHLGESGHKALCFSMESSEIQNVRNISIKQHKPQSWGFALVQAGVNLCCILIIHNPSIMGMRCWCCPLSLHVMERLIVFSLILGSEMNCL